MRCGKCAAPLESQASRDAAATGAENRSLEQLLRQTALCDDDWALEAELRGVERLVRSLYSQSYGGLPSAIHDRHASPPAMHVPTTQRPAQEPVKASPVVPPAKSHTVAWMCLSLGLATFACGAVLLGWSLAADRQDLWPIGMPLALFGQAGLLLGLILQLDGLWQTNRQTAAALSDLDGELSRVRHATTLLSTSKSGAAQSFYVHLAEGASPQLLLADLKGQLDLLAEQMAAQRRQ